MAELDLDAEIVAARVAGVPEREICRELGCTIERVHAVLDSHAARVLAPENVLKMLLDDLGKLAELERAARAGDATKLARLARRQRERTARLIL